MFKLDTKSVVPVNSITMISTQSSVIDRVNEMAKAKQQPNKNYFLSNNVLLFKDL